MIHATKPSRHFLIRLLHALGRLFKKKKKPTGSIYPLR